MVRSSIAVWYTGLAGVAFRMTPPVIVAELTRIWVTPTPAPRRVTLSWGMVSGPVT